jgi:hypothetical protein
VLSRARICGRLRFVGIFLSVDEGLVVSHLQISRASDLTNDKDGYIGNTFFERPRRLNSHSSYMRE